MKYAALSGWAGQFHSLGAARCHSTDHLIAGGGVRVGIFIGLAVIAVASPAPAADAAHSSAAVIAADEAWGAAEVNGDASYVEQLLLPGYLSIGADGKPTSREAIVASVRRRGGKSDILATQVATWKAAHPSDARVSMHGETAVLTWNSRASSGEVKVYSSDVFTYREGQWRAVFSQHSSAAN